MNEPENATPPTVQPAAPDPSSSVPSGSPSAGVATKRLTTKQQAVYDLARPEKGKGKTRAEIAALLGISKPVVSKTLQAAYKKLGLSLKTGLVAANNIEVRDPEKLAALVDNATDPLIKLQDAYEAAGFPRAAGTALLRRIRQKYFGVVEATKSLKSAEIVDALNHKIDLALRYMDDKTMAEASFRDLALGTTAMIEKRQLLRGEPTAIVSDHERKKLHELLPAFIEEARRRGAVTLDGKTGEVVESR